MHMINIPLNKTLERVAQIKQYKIHNILSWVVIGLAIAGGVMLYLIYESGGQFFDVGKEAYITRIKLDILDNTTKNNQLKIEHGIGMGMINQEKLTHLQDEMDKLLKHLNVPEEKK